MNESVEFITLADGTKINTANGKKLRQESNLPPGYASVPTHAQAVRAVTATRMRIADLPVPPRQMNIISVILMYSMVGMLEHEIALATGITVDQVNQIRTSQAYNTMYNTVSKNIIEQDMDDVREVIKRHSIRAVEKVVEIMEESDDKNSLKAAQDVLDRAGHRPADIVQHMHNVNGGLKIEFIQKKNENALPVINIEHGEQ